MGSTILGALGAIFIPPIAELFPFVYLYFFGFTPGFLIIIIIWLVGVVGIFMSAAASKERPGV